MAKDSTRNPHTLAPTPASMNALPMGAPRVAGPQRGLIKKKGNVQAGGEPPTAFHRQGVQRSGERMGARRRIDIRLPGPESPEAFATMSKARTVRAVMGSKQNFWQQATQKW
jgi:hypothetical protein